MKSEVGRTRRLYVFSRIYLYSISRSIESYLARGIRITTFGYAESRVGSTGLDYLTRRARISGTSSSRGIDVFNSASRYTNILVNSFLYLTISFEVFSNFLILYYLSYIGLYPFYFTRYSIAILRSLENILLFSRRLILYDFSVRVSSSIKILLE